MHERILKKIKELIRQRLYIMSIHAVEEMNDDELSIYDVERIILTGNIIERQKDKNINEWKYIIEGKIILEHKAIVVAKISITGKLIIITVFKL